MQATAFPGWRVWADAVQGARATMQDRWAAVRTTHQGRPALALGVFDGVSGSSAGAGAAEAAAHGLAAAVAAAGSPDEVLARLNVHVRRTRGATTAAVALALEADDPGTPPLVALGAGDSSLYALSGGRLRNHLPRHRVGRVVVTQYLGKADLQAHAMAVPGRPRRLLLCTDGVDNAVPAQALRDALVAPDGAAALARLLAQVRAAGAPDNATAVVAERLRPARPAERAA